MVFQTFFDVEIGGAAFQIAFAAHALGVAEGANQNDGGLIKIADQRGPFAFLAAEGARGCRARCLQQNHSEQGQSQHDPTATVHGSHQQVSWKRDKGREAGEVFPKSAVADSPVL